MWPDDDAIERALREYTRGMTQFPTRRELDADGRSDLRSVIDEFGGPDYWAERLGLALSPRQLASRPYSQADAIADAKRAMAEAPLGRLPGAGKLRAAGLSRLATEVEKAGGARRFCAKHGLS